MGFLSQHCWVYVALLDLVFCCSNNWMVGIMNKKWYRQEEKPVKMIKPPKKSKVRFNPLSKDERFLESLGSILLHHPGSIK